MPRTVTLALVSPSGTVLGALPPFTVPAPWWQEAAEVVAGARRHHGVDVTVLRLLAADGERVTYLAECLGAPGGLPLRHIDVDLSPDPRRAPYAEIGGPAATLGWIEVPLQGTRTKTSKLQSGVALLSPLLLKPPRLRGRS